MELTGDVLAGITGGMAVLAVLGVGSLAHYWATGCQECARALPRVVRGLLGLPR